MAMRIGSAMLSLVLVACGSGTLDPVTPPDGGSPQRVVTLLEGTAQTGLVGTPLDAPLRLRVTTGGVPTAGLPVYWSTLGSGTITGDPVTDQQGEAAAQWTLPLVSGIHKAIGYIDGTAAPAYWSATAEPGPAVTISTDLPAFGVDDSLLLLVLFRDAHENGVPGVPLQVTLRSGALVVGTAGSQSGGDGIASTTIRLTDGTGAPLLGAMTVEASNGAGLVTVQPFYHATFAMKPIYSSFPSEGDLEWTPTVGTVKAGTTVHWLFSEGGHALFLEGSGQVGSESMPAGGAVTLLVAGPGSYQFHCPRHPDRGDEQGTLIVLP